MQQRLFKQRETEATSRMRMTITSLLQTQFFFGSLALNMGLIEDNSRQTIAADGANIKFNSKWVMESHVEEIKPAIARIVLACALKHHTRRGDRSYERWQRASKMVTEPFLHDMGLKSDGTGIDKSIEQAYEMLDDMPEDDSSQGDNPGMSISIGVGSGGTGSSNQSDQDQGQGGQGQGDQGQGGQGQGDQGQGDQGQGDQGQGGQGQGGQGQGGGRSNQPSSYDPTGTGEVMDADPNGPKSDSPVSVDQLEQDWDRAMHQALQSSKAQGRDPGNLSELISKAHSSIIDWRNELREFLKMNASEDFSWTKPNVRLMEYGFFPSRRSENIPSIVLAIDTSWSMDTESLKLVWSEIRNLAMDMVPDQLSIIQCDTKVNFFEKYNSYDLPAEWNALGRGGTEYIPVFKHLDYENEKPVCMIYFTDLECYTYPDFPPDYPVLWASTGGPKAPRPPFGEVIDII